MAGRNHYSNTPPPTTPNGGKDIPLPQFYDRKDQNPTKYPVSPKPTQEDGIRKESDPTNLAGKSTSMESNPTNSAGKSTSKESDPTNIVEKSIPNESEPMDLVGKTIQMEKLTCIVKRRVTCGEELYAMESSIPMKSYTGRCPQCHESHVRFENPERGFYVSVIHLHNKMQQNELAEDRAKGPKSIDQLRIVKTNLSPLDDPIVGQNKGIEGDSNSCYMDSTIFCMFAYSRMFDALLHMKLDSKPMKDLQRLLRENIVNVLRSEKGFVERDAVFHLRDHLSKATNDPSFKEVEKDPSELLRAFEQLFHYAPLQTIPSSQAPNENGSNITTNIIWEMFDANPQKLLQTSIASIFRNSLIEIRAKLASIPSALILLAPRHSRSQRSYRYIIPDRQITLDHNTVQFVCLKCNKTNDDSESWREFYFCPQCFSHDPRSKPTLSTNTTVICYCEGCIKGMHHDEHPEDVWKHVPIRMKEVQFKLNLFAVLCIETSHYVAFVKCHKQDGQHEWVFFDSMSDRVQNEKNIPCVSRLPNFDQWIDDAENDKYFFADLDKRRQSGRPMAQEFKGDEMQRLRLFRDGAFFFYENATADYQ